MLEQGTHKPLVAGFPTWTTEGQPPTLPRQKLPERGVILKLGGINNRIGNIAYQFLHPEKDNFIIYSLLALFQSMP